MNKESRNDKKQICVKLSIEDYNELERKAAIRKLDKTNYLIYLIRHDQDDLFSENAARVLNDITCSTEKLLNILPKDNTIRPFIVKIIKGVNELWQYLQ